MDPGTFGSSNATMAAFGVLSGAFPGPPAQSVLNTSGLHDAAALPDTVAGPSTQRRQSDTPEAAKKKRSSQSTPDGTGDASAAQAAQATKERKKKASRACIHCQKAHLTCDDTRPCQRCIKRGIEDTCVEGHRKKAKYLLDDNEIPTRRRTTDRSKEPDPPDTSITNGLQDVSASIAPDPLSMSLDSQVAPTAQPTSSMPDPFLNLTANPAYNFESTAANLEYSILSAMLGNPTQFDDPNARLPSPPPSTTMANFAPQPNASWPNVPTPTMNTNGMNFFEGMNSVQAPVHSSPMDTTTSIPGYNQVPGPSMNRIVNGSVNTGPTTMGQLRPAMNTLLAPPTPPTSDDLSVSPSMPVVSPTAGTSQPFIDGAGDSQKQPAVTESTGEARIARRAADVYKNVTEPYNYVNGYHYLMQYLQGRFDKMDILRIVRALAIFRPSLIALQVPLTREDEIFAEQALQRSLMEIEKLISYSGTPTAVWRRTGEICLVGVEFVMLTGWSQAELISENKFIYELFEHQSVVEYWEKFAAHAFESASQTVYSHSVLLKPTGEPIPCAFCFSIRRDVFDLPNLVIGQWLPLL